MEKHLLMVRVVEHWERSMLGGSQGQQPVVLGNLLPFGMLE